MTAGPRLSFPLKVSLIKSQMRNNSWVRLDYALDHAATRLTSSLMSLPTVMQLAT